MRGLTAPLVKLGAFIAVTVLVTGVLAVSIANINLSDTVTYKARFTDATMVIPNDDVRIAGVRVGQVSSVEIVDRRLAEVEFEIDAARELPANVQASIKYRNLVGQRYIALERAGEGGVQQAAHQGGGNQPGGGSPQGTLEPGETIPLEQTTPALDLDQLFNGFKPLFRALSPDDVNKLSYEIIQVLQGEGGTVESLLSHTASLTTKLAEKDQVIGQVIDNLNTVLTTVNERTPQLDQLIVRLQKLVSGLAKDKEPIGQSIDALGGLAQTTAGLLKETREPLKQDIKALGELAGNLNEQEQVVEHFIQFLPEKAKRMAATADYGSWFNFYLCSASGNVRIPGLMSEPVNVPIAPVNRERCTSE
ncbi:phospholipid/cholesterol/gamma-HCH transport system substrate-binding protein [Prauserella isguenensis]|uniref:Phospholipid/cholesterol/gamma-HCH transport system substrate-binding protein n=1 Tax=Prauserella isguenensis TaxID=1470180 RepID=A0A839RTY9_9PSEU|nr:MCE family protein [Prauserella isguenensis]MBB3049181.1 phospholipid/cholesterol/gamma-HCH transport system substrate-binding protein [Prauserella isguenensis]